MYRSYKYSFKDKVKAIRKRCYHHETYNQIKREMGISMPSIKEWIGQYRNYGLKSLKIRYAKRNFSFEFRLKVVRNYLNSFKSEALVAHHFGIRESQLSRWKNNFQKYGKVGLTPISKPIHNKNRKSYVDTYIGLIRRRKLKDVFSIKSNDSDKIIIQKLKDKLKKYQLDHDILKAIAQLKLYPINKRQK